MRVLRDDSSYTDTADPGEPGTALPRISITRQEGDLLRWLVRDLVVLEIGTGLGISTQYLCESARLVYSLDIDPWVQQTVWPALNFRFKNLVCLPDRDAPVFKVVMEHFQAAFIDGSHSPKNVQADLEFVWPRLMAPGLLLFHDANSAEVCSAVNIFFDGNHAVSVLNTTHGLGLIWKLSSGLSLR